MVMQLADEPVQFRIFCSNHDLGGTVLNVPIDQWVQYNRNTAVWYSSTNKLGSVLSRELINRADCRLFIVGLYDPVYNFKPLFRFSKIQKIISVRGMLHPGALSQKAFKKKLYLQFWKLLGWPSKFLFHVTDEQEREYVLKQFGRHTRTVVAGNFPLIYDRMELPQKEAGVLKLVSVALISAMKNILMVLESLFKIAEVYGLRSTLRQAQGYIRQDQGDIRQAQGEIGFQIEYNIYGPVKDEVYWEQCLELIKELPSNIKVHYHGAVEPVAIKAALEDNHVFILPSKSENFGHSIFEALSAGRPVITSRNTPWNGLQSRGAGINVDGENVTEIEEAIGFFLDMPPDELVKWSKAAHEHAVRSVDGDKIKEEYRQMFGISTGT